MAMSTPLHLLLLEDDTDLGQAVADHLRSAGHQVQWCRCIADARAAAAPMLALLDLHLPDGDGLDLLRGWRAAGQTWPVIVLTARDQVSDRIRLLQAGADDYLVKPFDLDELLARVSAVSRRALAPLSDSAGTPAAARRIDLDARQAWLGAEQLDLTQMEWAVLACLAQRRGRIYSRGEIEVRLDAVGLAEAASNSLEVIVSRLRKKLGADAITTHRGLGYRLEA
jgi:two-component system OmpR family response regulator